MPKKEARRDCGDVAATSCSPVRAIQQSDFFQRIGIDLHMGGLGRSTPEAAEQPGLL
jgi:hypothetical protein